jgi:hypothetical protein
MPGGYPSAIDWPELRQPRSSIQEEQPKDSAAYKDWLGREEALNKKDQGHGPWTSKADTISKAAFDKAAGGDPLATTTTPAESPWEQLAGSLVGSYQTAESALNALAAGGPQQAAQENAQMGAGAAAMLGQGSGGPAAQYFAQQSQAAQSQAQGAGLYGAEAQVAKDEQAASSLEQTGLKGLGTAEAAQAMGAPYQQLLSSLASEVPYHLASGYSIPALQNAPSWLTQAESATGVTPAAGTGAGGAGLPGATQAAAGAINAPATPQASGANASQTG